jgi:hypothetical protein
MIARGSTRSPLLAVWARLELSVVLSMVLAFVLSARPLVEVSTTGLPAALATTGKVFAAFMLGELVGMPLTAWFREARGWRLVRPLLAAMGLGCAIAGIVVTGPAARAACYGIAGMGAEVVATWIMDEPARSPLLRRRTELLVLAATCAVVLVSGTGLLVVAAGPLTGLWPLALCGAGQAAVVLITVVYTLYPPPPSSFPLA